MLRIKERDAWGWRSPEMVLAQHLEVAGGDISAGCGDKWNVTRESAEGSTCWVHWRSQQSSGEAVWAELAWAAPTSSPLLKCSLGFFLGEGSLYGLKPFQHAEDSHRPSTTCLPYPSLSTCPCLQLDGSQASQTQRLQNRAHDGRDRRGS